jgi:peptide chain release factor 2
MRQRQQLERALQDFRRLERELDDNVTLVELGEAESDASTIAEGEAALARLEEEVQKKSVEALLSGEADAMNTYVEVHAGAGGTESQDWASMLARMYMRWAERRGFKVRLVDESPGEEAGIKSATLEIEGENAYGWLKTEAGVHRLVRISPYDSNARRHTSFASVTVYPVVDDTIDIEVNPADVDISFARSSGAGGQHVIPAPEQGDRLQAAQGAPLRGGAQEARAEGLGRAGGQDRDRLGSPDPLLCAAALSAGEGSENRVPERQPRGRA